MKKQHYIIIGVLLVLAAGWYFYPQAEDTSTEYDDFAKCLTEKGFSMGGTDWCPHCADQKKMFGKSFFFVDYHNCDFDRAWCDKNNIESYPTWITPEGEALKGVQQLPVLAGKSGCLLYSGA